jgi:hypothetical protein
VAGTTDPEVLADLARGQLRRKLPALREALEGRFSAKHALIVGQILAHIDFLDEAIERLSEAIEERLGPFGNQQVQLRCTIPGIQRRAAEVILAETGADMTRFARAGHLASWAGVCPGNDESAGTRRSGRARTGSKWLRQTLTESAKAAARTKGACLAARYARTRARRGGSRATLAVAHSIVIATWHMLGTGETDVDPGGDFFARRDPERATRRLVAQLERLGHTVVLEEAARAPAEGSSLQKSAARLPAANRPRRLDNRSRTGVRVNADATSAAPGGEVIGVGRVHPDAPRRRAIARSSLGRPHGLCSLPRS